MRKDRIANFQLVVETYQRPGSQCFGDKEQAGENPPSTSAIFTNGLQSLAHLLRTYVSVPGGSDGKESACNAGDLASIPESRRSSGEGNGNPLQYSCLENPMDRGAQWATVHRVAKSQTRLSMHTFHDKRKSLPFLPWHVRMQFVRIFRRKI